MDPKIKFKSFFGYALNSAQDGERVFIGFQFNVTGPLKPANPEKMILQTLEDFVFPEVVRRVEKGTLSSKFNLRNAQILLFSDYSRNDVLLNDEVHMKLLVKMIEGKSFKKGDQVKYEDISEILGIYPNEKNDPNAAHIMLVKFKTQWYVAMDLVYDREKVGKKIVTAKSFLKSVKQNLKAQLWHPFIDNLFSVTELTVQSSLLLRHYNEFSIKQSHEETRKHFTGYCKIGNAPEKFSKHYIKLFELRKKARYSQGMHGKDFTIKKEKAEDLLSITLEIIEHVTKIFETIDFLRKPKTGEYVEIGQS